MEIKVDNKSSGQEDTGSLKKIKIDKRDAITRVIDSNPCRTCARKKLGHCECRPAVGGVEICSSEEEQHTTADEETLKKILLEEERKEEEELELELALAKMTLTPEDDFDLRKIYEFTFDPEIISEMLSRRLLLIDNDYNLGIFSIVLQYEFDKLAQHHKTEFRKYIETILRELIAFQLANNINVDCASLDRNNMGNIIAMRINFPKPALFDAFMKHLILQNLLPILLADQKNKNKIHYPEGVNHFNLNPLATRLTRTGLKRARPYDQDEQHNFRRPRSILDGLKRT
jgi:hypothetical protein